MNHYWRTFILVIAVTLSNFISTSTYAKKSTISQNKKVVQDFYETAFNKHQPKKAMDLYVGKYYRQHNPFAGDGKQPFIEFFESHFKKNPDARVEIKRIIAEGDLVMVHVHSKQNPKDRGSAVVDIFRIEDGKIVEHWDVVQEIPEKLAHDNTMF